MNDLLLYVAFLLSMPLLFVVIILYDYLRRGKYTRSIRVCPDSKLCNIPYVSTLDYIPRIVHRSGKNHNILSEFQDCIAASVQYGFQEKFYNDQECEQFLKTHFEPRVINAWQAIRPHYGASKADLFRYCLIYYEGGIWLDLKSKILDSWDLLGNQLTVGFTNSIFGPFYSVLSIKGELTTRCFASPPGNPILARLIQEVVYNIELERTRSKPTHFGGLGVLCLTGPYIFTKVLSSFSKKIKYLSPTFDGHVKTLAVPNYTKLYKKHRSTSYWDYTDSVVKPL